MFKKTKKVKKLPLYANRFRKIYRRYQRNYVIIVCLGIAVVFAIWYYADPFWGAIALAFGIWSLIWYEDGAHESCMDEYEFAYPEEGFRKMLKSWPCFAAIAGIVYFLCKSVVS